MWLSGLFVFAVSTAVVSAAVWAGHLFGASAVLAVAWAGALLPYAVAVARRGWSALAAVPGLVGVVSSGFNSGLVFHLIAVGASALEVKKPLGLVAYLLALSSLYNSIYAGFPQVVSAVAAVALASYASVFHTRLDRGAALVLPIVAAESVRLTGLYALTFIYAALGASFFLATRRWFARAAALALVGLGIVAPLFYQDGVTLFSLPAYHSLSSSLPPELAYLIKAVAAAALMFDAYGDRQRLVASVLASVGLFFVPTPTSHVAYSEGAGLLVVRRGGYGVLPRGRKAF